jgi:hypothetical protein
MRLLRYLKDEMFQKIGCLILVKSNLLQRVRTLKKKQITVRFDFPRTERTPRS